MINSTVLIDTINTLDGTYQDVPFESSLLSKNKQYFSNTNGSTAPIVYNDGFTFTGTNGLIYTDSKGFIDLSINNLYIEFDFTLSSTDGDVNGFQTLFSICPLTGTSYITEACYVSTLYGLFTLTTFNTSTNVFASHYINHKFEINTKYNIKILKTSTNGLSIFLNNELKYRVLSYNTRISSSNSTKSTYYYDNYLRIGQEHNTQQNHNLKGKIHDFRAIYYIGGYNGQCFETNANNLIHHFKMDGYTYFAATIWRYYAATDLGNNPLNSTITIPVITANSFTNLSDNELFWYTPLAGAANRLTISKNPLKYYEDVTISFRIKTKATVETCSIFDCRSAVGSFDGILVALSGSDPSKINIQLSSKSNTTSWPVTISTPPGTILPNSEYRIHLVKQGNVIRLYVNSIEQISYTADFTDINWVSEKLDIFNNVSGNNESKFYVKDFRIYNIVYIDQDSIDQSKILSTNINSSNYINVFTHTNDAPLTWNKEQIRFTSGLFNAKSIDVDNQLVVYEDNNALQFNERNIFVEGHKDYTFNLYKSNDLVLKNINNKLIQYGNLSDYYYIINETGIKKQIPEKSMVESSLIIYLDANKCIGSDFYVRLHRNNTGEFIGDYDLINNTVTIHNLDYNSYYDAILIDKNKVLENIVRSKLKPSVVINNVLKPRDSNTYLRELSYYEAKIYLGSIIDTLIESNTDLSLLSVLSINSDINSVMSKIYINSNSEYIEKGILNFTYRIVVDEYVESDSSTIKIKIHSGSDKILSGTLIQIGNEIMQIENYSPITNTISIKRGVLDTYPEIIKRGQHVLILSECWNDLTNYNKDDTVSVKAVTSLGYIDQDIDSIKEKSIIFNGRIARPLPPRNIKINGQYNFNDTQNISTLDITWNYRNNDSITDYYNNDYNDINLNTSFIISIYKTDYYANEDYLILSENIGNLLNYSYQVNEMNPQISSYKIQIKAIKGTISSYEYTKIINLNTTFVNPQGLHGDYII